MTDSFDVVIIGAGNAAFSAAHAAAEHTRSICMLEKSPDADLGGNSYFTLGSFRTTYDGIDDLRTLLPNLTDEEAAEIDLPPYTVDDFEADLLRLTQGRTDPELKRMLVTESFSTLKWLKDVGIVFALQDDNQTFRVGGKKRFWGGGTLQVDGGGIGLIQQHRAAAERVGVEIRAEHRMTGYQLDESGRITAVVCATPDGPRTIQGKSFVLAAGGFEADARLRAVHLGPGWDMAKVRGSRYNTGEALLATIDLGARAFGNWSGAHAVGWDRNAGDFGDRVLTNKLQRHSYPFGIMVNTLGRRFVDEGSDFRNYTYARIGAAVLQQPGGVAHQIFDRRSAGFLRTDYSHEGVTRFEANTIPELAELIGVDPEALANTVAEFNASINDREFRPTERDGRATQGIVPPKSNWALEIGEPPFVAFSTVCAITFTYGGVKIDGSARVLDHADRPIPGLHAAGEVVGGLFFDNYPGGSGLMSGAVFGRTAGRTAGRYAVGA